MPPWRCCAAYTTRCAASDAQNFAMITSALAGRPSPSRHAAWRIVSRIASTSMYASAARWWTAWKLARGRPNCSREVVYSAVMRSARSATPSWSAQSPTSARSTIQPSAPVPRARISPSAPASVMRACGSRWVATWRSSVTPLPCGSTRKSAGSPSVRAGTTTRAAACAAGTHVFTPSRRQRLPSARALVSGAPGSSAPTSTSAAVRITSPRATPGSQRARCSRLPSSANGSAPRTRVGQAGTGATADPTSSSTRQSSTRPRPLPPCSSGIAVPRSRVRASASQASRSMPSPLASSRFRRSCVTWSPRTFRARSRSASCSGVRAKSIVPPSARARHPEAGHRDDVALDLVRAAPEGEDQGRPVHAFDTTLHDRVRRTGAQRARLAHHLEQQLVDLDVRLAAEDLHRRRLGEVERPARHAPRLLPVEELQYLELGEDAREMRLHPRTLDHSALACPREDVLVYPVDEADR